jgi:pectate lyase
LVIALAGCCAAQRPLAFPGAEGFGAQTPGGRDGKVIFVSNLNDAGPGSFRAACEAPGRRVVVFRVSGIIDLSKSIVIREPYITIAGQTAPGDGICLRRHGLEIRTHDVIVRFLRSRPGDLSGDEVDSISIGGDSRGVILDHCSAGWSVDECLSPSGAIADVTVQWSIIAEGLNHSVHSKGAHGYGSLVRASGGLTLHHNLWAHNNARNPRLGDNYNQPPYPTFDVRNNVMYNYGSICSGMTGDILSVNYVANYIKPGPSSNRRRGPIVFTDQAAASYYLSGNVVEGRPELTADNTRLFDRVEFKGRKLVTVMPKPFSVPEVMTSTAQAAYEAVLAGAGAILPVRDAVDQRIVSEVRSGTGSIIDSQWEAGGWPVYRSTRPLPDRDRDGMPDAWETAHKLNPDDPSDAAARNADGYTNLERYLNQLAQGPRQARKSDLRR